MYANLKVKDETKEKLKTLQELLFLTLEKKFYLYEIVDIILDKSLIDFDATIQLFKEKIKDKEREKVGKISFDFEI
ncbi:MAG: hypothetical protein ACP6IS_11405 [Candidatus Asgardarchaeia archaeon]